MEKRKAHYSLATIQSMILHVEQRKITQSAYKTAFELGFSEEDIVETIKVLSPQHLYKSMTTNADSTIWQDVYHIKNKDFDLYVKLQIVDKAIVVSFKEH
jgi:motility quorum-sensing regulator/GCU-specific mRNA interferase toxin